MLSIAEYELGLSMTLLLGVRTSTDRTSPARSDTYVVSDAFDNGPDLGEEFRDFQRRESVGMECRCASRWSESDRSHSCQSAVILDCYSRVLLRTDCLLECLSLHGTFKLKICCLRVGLCRQCCWWSCWWDICAAKGDEYTAFVGASTSPGSLDTKFPKRYHDML